MFIFFYVEKWASIYEFNFILIYVPFFLFQFLKEKKKN